ncbi:MAG: hypothetical protein LBV13_05900 [Methanomassiliicoccaceae archaeon]|nr:hypothetical protein [Methanomassiliicoccaceae archaeon]
MDYQDKGVPDAERFYAANRNLPREAYRARIIETYGPASGRDRKIEAIVNAAVLAYVLRK